MKPTVAQLLPELLESVCAALREEGRHALASSLGDARVERWTYDSAVNAGYIYLAQSKPVHQGETPAAETLAFMFEHGFNVDLRAHGEIFGIELLEHAQLFARLAAMSQP